MVPRFKELSVQSIWTLVKESEELTKYSPDYADNQLPDRKYMFSIIATLKSERIRSIIKNARKSRVVQNENNEEELVYITKSMYEEINEVLTQNCENRMLII